MEIFVSIIPAVMCLRDSLCVYINSDAQLENLYDSPESSESVSKIISDVSFYNMCKNVCDEYRGNDIVVPELMDFVLMYTIGKMVVKNFGYTEDSLEYSEKCASISKKNIRKTCMILMGALFMHSTIPERVCEDDSDSDDSNDPDGIFTYDEEKDEDSQMDV